jgi:membrane protein implicated in regulation of membrane protease activity
VLATVFHFAGFGAFAEWPVMAWPWQWSCFCIAIWWTAIIVLVISGIAIFYIIRGMREKKKSEEAKKKMDIAKLAAMGRFDEAREAAKKYWPNGVPEKVMKHIEEQEERSKNESYAS